MSAEGARLSATNVPLADYAPASATNSVRRDSLGLSLESSNALWRALDRATAHVIDADPSGRHSTAARQNVVTQAGAAAAAIRRTARRTSDSDRCDVSALSLELLEVLRQEFLRELRDEPTLDGRQVVRVLLAFDTLGKRQAPAPRRNHASPGLGFDALVEVAHDMRSPLTSILFLVDAIRATRSGPVNRVQQRQLGLIYGAALGLSTLVSDLIDLVRGEGGGLVEGDPAPFSVAETLCGVRDIVSPIAEEKGLKLECIPPEIDGRIGYATAVSRVLLNLTTNALKFTQSGTVRMACSQSGSSRVLFSVTDSGAGLPQEVRRALFSPFRHSGGRVRFSNSGLGLSICRTLLSAMNSELHVEKSGVRGTRFSFELELPPAQPSTAVMRE